jgi:hypothetical protein
MSAAMASASRQKGLSLAVDDAKRPGDGQASYFEALTRGAGRS